MLRTSELTKSPVPVPVTSLDGPTNTVWIDGNRLVAYIRDRMLSRLQISRVPLLLRELRSGDHSRAAREIAGDGSVSQVFTGRVVRELVTCYDGLRSRLPEVPWFSQRVGASVLPARR